MNTNKIWFFLLAVSLFATACNKSNDNEEFIGNWRRMGDLDGPKREGASCFVLNNEAYVGLGYSGRERYADFWKFSITNDGSVWTQVASLDQSQARSSASAFATLTRGYICCGYTDSDTYLNDLWEYNPTTNSWNQRASLPGAARADAVAIGVDNLGYLGGGGNYNTDFKDFYKFEPSNGASDTLGKWISAGSIGGGDGRKSRGSVIFAIDKSIYIALGKNSDYLAELYCYNTSTGTWIPKNKMFNATNEAFDDSYDMMRAYGVAFTLDKKAYIALGESGGMFRRDVWEYEPTTDRWNKKTNFEGTPRNSAVAFTIHDPSLNKNRAFIATGGAGLGISKPLDDVWEFEPNKTKDDKDNY